MGKLYTSIHQGKKHGRMMLDSIDNSPLVYPTVKENRQARLKKYFELTKEQKLQDDCDVQATNIILHHLPPDMYALVNHQEVAKAIWDKVKLLMKGTKLSYQERECRLVWKLVRYGVSKGLDTVYLEFLGVGTTFDILQNIYILYLEYGVLSFSGYGVLSFFPLWSLASAGTDTPYLP
nr:hypothetical protein [Tanacetum cinerariifolium]